MAFWSTRISWKRIALALVILAGLTAAVLALQPGLYTKTVLRMRGQKTVQARLEEHGSGARARLTPFFQASGVSYPPGRLVLVGVKSSKILQVYASAKDAPVRFIRSYPILAASGQLGPKLRRGDGQVPEGIYRVVSLNPNSRFHLALRLDYPNAFDRDMAVRDGRTDPGDDIMIHGSDCSIGCLAMGNEAIEELFVLAADVGMGNIKVVLTPADLRSMGDTAGMSLPPWYGELLQRIEKELRELPEPG